MTHQVLGISNRSIEDSIHNSIFQCQSSQQNHEWKHAQNIWSGLIVLIATLSSLLVNGLWEEENEPLNAAWSEDNVLFDFAKSTVWAFSNIVNDGVMDGVSRSRMAPTEQWSALFSGEVVWQQ